MILSKETVFYDYDLFSKNTEKFRELFMTQEDDDFVVVSKDTNISIHHLAIQLGENKNNCIVWKFEAELKGEYSFNDLQKIVPNGDMLMFVTNFDSGTFMNTIPLKGLFGLHHPYVKSPYVSCTKHFYFDGKVSFLCGSMHEKAYDYGLNNKFYIRADKHIVALSNGLYGIIDVDKETYRRLKQKEFLESIKLT